MRVTQKDLLDYIRDNPDHVLVVSVDNDGQIVIFTGLQLSAGKLEPIDYD